MDPYDAGELLAACGRAVLEVMLRKAAYALAVVRGVRDPSAEGNRNHNKRFVALATEIGPSGQKRWPADQTARLTDETTAAYADVTSASDSARPFPSCRQVTALRRLT